MNAPGSPLPPVLAAAFDAGAFLMRYPDVAGWCLAAVKSSVIVLMALTLASLFRRRSAVARCWILRLAFPALVMTALWPFAAGHLPVLFVRLQAPAPVEARVETVAAVPPAAPRPEIIPPHEREMPHVQAPDAVNAAPPVPSVPVAPIETAVPGRMPIMAEPAWKAWAGWWEGRLLPAWLGGALLAAAWMCARNLAGLFWLHARGVPAGGNITSAGDALTDLLRMKRGTYRLVPGLASPLLTGWLRPRLWLPPDAAQMAEPQVRAILHHELAHHRRKDLQWQALASLGFAIWWWNPLVWSLRKRLRNEAELAADEAVVSGSGLAADYAELLVRVASGWTADDARMIRRTGVPMMGSSSIERRVRAILAENPFRNRMGWTAGVVVAFIAIMGAGIASLTAIAQPAEPEVRKPPVVERLPREAFGDVKAVKLLELMQREDLRPPIPDYLHPPSGPVFMRDSSGPQDYSAMERLDARIEADFPEQFSAGPIRSNTVSANGATPGGGEITTTRAAAPGEGATEIYMNGRYVGSTSNMKFAPLPSEANLRFVDSGTGRPMPGMKFRIGLYGGLLFQVATDEAGRYRFVLPDSKKETGSGTRKPEEMMFDLLQVTVSEPGYMVKMSAFNRSDWSKELEIRMEPDVPLSGRVIGEDGRPVAGAKISVTSKTPNWQVPVRPPLFQEVVTDREGYWKLGGYPRDLSLYSFDVSHPDHVPFVGGAGLIPGGQAGLQDGSSTLVLKNGPRIHGKVIDSQGRAVVGARINKRDADSPGGAITDEEGRFLLKRLKGKYALITIEARGFAPSQEGALVDSAEPYVFSLRTPSVFRGRVLRENGKPYAGAEIRLAKWRNQSTLGFRTRADEEGRFIWDSAPDEPFTLDVGEGVSTMTGYPIPRPDGEAVIIVKPALRIAATVLDDATGQPVRNFRVTPVYTDPWAYRDPFAPVDGKFGWETYRFDRNGVRFRVEAEGYATFTTEPYATRQQKLDEVWRIKR